MDENDPQVEVEETQEETTTEETTQADKPKETPQQKKARLQRQLKQLNKQLGEDDEPAPSKPKSTELDYGQKAFLTASLGIKGSEEWALVREYVAAGKSIDDLLDNRHFNNDLKDLRDNIATKEAIPNSSKRSGQSARDSVDYWVSKGGLPEDTPENTKLRRDIVNARIQRETNGSKFAKGGIIQ